MNPLVHVALKPGKGRALLASTDIQKGKLIDACPVVLLSKKQARHLDHTPLRDYYMKWDGDIDVADDAISAVAFGLVSVCNHSNEPNATAQPYHHSNEMLLLALRDIEPGEEITIKYAQVWFTEAT